MPADPKPLPVGTHRLELMCSCGRLIPPGERKVWHQAPVCPECYGRTRVWWRRPVSLLERFRAWLELKRWKKRRSKLYGG